MTTLRRILITALAVIAISAVASASTITIGYSTTISATPTDLTNVTASLPGFDPGSGSATLSNVTGAGYTTGISMSSLDAANTSYQLVGYNISVKTVLSGSYTVTNAATASSTASGNVSVDTYTAVALGSALSPALATGVDPNNDPYNCSQTGLGVVSTVTGCLGASNGGGNGEQTTSIGGSPDPESPNSGTFNLGAGQDYTSGPLNVNSGWIDLGCEISEKPNLSTINQFNPNAAFSDCQTGGANSSIADEITTSLGSVEQAALTAYFSTLTTTNQSVTGGNLSSTYNTSVAESIEITYTYTSGSAPEPGTMALMGGALLGLGLMRKRLKKS